MSKKDAQVSRNVVFIKDPVTEEEKLIGQFESEGTIGKSNHAQVVLKDLRCDDLHVLIESNPKKKGFFQLIDLGSHFGTYIDEDRIQETQIQTGQIFRIGTKDILIRPSEINPKEIRNLLAQKDKKIENKAKESTYDLVTNKRLLQVALYWGDQILDMRTFSTGTDITIGSGIQATFNVVLSNPKYSNAPFKIGSYSSGQLKINVPGEANGLVWLGNDTYSIDKLRHKDQSQEEFGDLDINLRIGDRADIHFGELTLSFRFVPPSKKIPFTIPRIDKQLLKILGMLLLFYSSIFLWLGTSELDPHKNTKTIKDIPKHLRKVLYNAGIDSAMKQQQAAIGELIRQLEGGRARSEEGKSKAKKSKKKQKKSPKKKSKTKKKTTKKTAKKSRPRKVIKKESPVFDLDSAFSSSSKKTSITKSTTLIGEPESGNTAAALAKGGFARGRKGLGAGGGGKSVGIGQLKGYSTGGGMGAGDYGLSPSKGREIKIPESEEVVILGGLDPDVIAAIIRRYLPQIQHCYEQQLALNPKLKGKVAVSFTIAGNGRVKKAKIIESSLKSKATESCIVKKVLKWKFPKPRGGGTVGVKYPFLLMSNTGK